MNPDPTSLDRMHDLVIPPPVSWWPPAPAWYGIMGVLVVGMIAGLVKIIIHHQANRYRREALDKLDGLKPALREPARRAEAVASLAELLKCVALSAFSRGQVAGLTGPAWLAFLDRTGGCTVFTRDEGVWLEAVAFDPALADRIDRKQVDGLIHASRRWIKCHRIGSEGKEAGD
jgi:hypothetical protein